MTAQLQSVINQAKRLSDAEQIALISAISDVLQKKYHRSNDFWNARTLGELIEERQINVANNIADLGGDFWPDEESVDEFNEFIQQQRRQDRLSE